MLEISKVTDETQSMRMKRPEEVTLLCNPKNH